MLIFIFFLIWSNRYPENKRSRERQWNTRFYLDPMPSYNVVQDKHAKQYTTTPSFQQRYKKLVETAGIQANISVPITVDDAIIKKHPYSQNPIQLKRRAVSASPAKKKKLLIPQSQQPQPQQLQQQMHRIRPQKSAPATNQSHQNYNPEDYFDLVPAADTPIDEVKYIQFFNIHY